jgi:hypothetical protein
MGCVEPFAVPSPWWRDLGLIHERLPGIVVLRLLSAEPAPDHRMAGRVSYLVQSLGSEPKVCSSGGVSCWIIRCKCRGYG